MSRTSRSLALASLAMAAALVLGACSGSSDAGSGGSDGNGGSTDGSGKETTTTTTTVVTAAPAGEPTIVLPDGTRIPAAADKPMLSWLAEAGAATDDSGSIGGKTQTLWECWDQNDPNDTGGSCGKCVVTILEGMANIEEASSKERNTIKKSNKKLGGRLDEAKCRLACQSKVKGPVKIQPSGKTDG